LRLQIEQMEQNANRHFVKQPNDLYSPALVPPTAQGALSPVTRCADEELAAGKTRA
jgi:hypothetical protein